MLQILCICSISPKLNNNDEVNKICESIASLKIKIDIANGLQSLLDNVTTTKPNKFGLLIVEHTDEIKKFRKYTDNINNNILYICFEKQKEEFINDPTVLYYDTNARKNFYHFLIKYLIKHYPDIDKLNKQINFLGLIDDIDHSIEGIKAIDNSTQYTNINTLFTAKNLWIAGFTACALILCIIWYKSTLIKEPQTILETNSSTQESNILVYNLPTRNIDFVGRDNAFKENLDKTKMGVVTQATVGSGGIGKTQLLTEYAYRAIENKEYDAILWINASSENTINNSYEDIANNLKINISDMNPASIKKHVHSELLDNQKVKRILFVLDNAPKSKDVQQYIKKLRKQWPINTNVHVLTSSRSQHWAGFTLILDVFTESEAKSFIKKNLPNAKEQDILNLIKIFNYYPLALGQAVGYIKQHTNIADYIELYTSEKKQYLDQPIDDPNGYAQTLWKLLDISLPKLSSDARKVLYMSSYLDPNKIQLKLFDIPIKNRVESIKELRDYSFISMLDDNKSFRIHALLQEVIRLKIEKESKWFNNVIQLATKVAQNFDVNKKDTWDIARRWLAHINLLYNYMDKTVDTADLLEKYGVVAKYFGLYDLAYELFTKSLRIQEDIYKKSDSIKLTKTLSKLGALELQLANYINAKKFYQRVLEIKKLHYKDGSSIELVETLNNLGMVELRFGLGNYNKAKQFYKKSLDIGKSYYKSVNHFKLADILLGLGIIENYFGYYNDAKELFEKVLIMMKKHYENEDRIEFISVLEHLAWVELYLGNYKKSRDVFKRIFEIRKTSSQKVNNISLVNSLQNSAILEWSVGNYQKAKILFREVLEILQDHYQNPKYIKMAHVFQGLGLVEFSLGNYLNAKELLEKDINIRKFYYKSPKHVSLGSSLLTLGLSNELLGNYNEALNYMERAYNILSTYYGDRIHKVMIADYTPALVWPKLDIKSDLKIVVYYEKALIMIKKIFGSEHHFVGRYYYMLGQVYEINGQKKEAIRQYRQALLIAERVAKNIEEDTIKINHQKNIETIKFNLIN